MASLRQGIRSTRLPLPDVYSTQLARNVASGKECIPALLVLGSILQFFRDKDPSSGDDIYLVFVPSTLGPCRTGQYHVFFDRLFEEMGWENVVLLVASSENSYRELGATFSRDVWRALVLGDYFADIRTSLRLLARDPGAALIAFRVGVAGRAARLPGRPQGARAGAQAGGGPPRPGAAEAPPGGPEEGAHRRRDLRPARQLLGGGALPDAHREGDLPEGHRHHRVVPLHRLRPQVHHGGAPQARGLAAHAAHGGLKDEAGYLVEKVWKENVEEKIAAVLRPTGLIPHVPHDMTEIIGEGQNEFVDPELESEATVSPAVGAAAMQDGYSGVAIIAPFGCLPGRLIEGVYAPWAKARDYPVLALENDGQPYPPNIVSRMEVFAHNVLRFESKRPSNSPLS